jgi:hypothetical protein
MKTIITLVLIAIIIICGWTGYKKGLIMGIGGILVIIASIYGAHLLSVTFSYEALPVMRPFASGYLESSLSDKEEKPGVLTEEGILLGTKSLEDFLKDNPEEARRLAQAVYERCGITEKTAAEMSAETTEYYAAYKGGFVSAMTEILCARISYVICFTLIFAIIAIILTVIGNLTNLSFKLPNLNLLNDISGALLGVFTGLMFCTVLVWVLKYMGMIIGRDTLAHAAVAKAFLSADNLAKILGY